MGYFKKLFDKAKANRKPKPIHKVKVLNTKKLPIPGFGGDEYFIQFSAKKNRKGKWEIISKTNCKIAIDGIDHCEKALIKIKAETLDEQSSRHWLNIDSAIICLEMIENYLIDYNQKSVGDTINPEEPNNYFKSTVDTLPKEMRLILEGKISEAEKSIKKEVLDKKDKDSGKKPDIKSFGT